MKTGIAVGLVLSLVVGRAAHTQQANPPGVTDKEIRIGQTWPYSGPLSLHSVSGKTQTAYFDMVNVAGGVNGRLIKFISLDDAYSPPKAVEQTRRLIEQDEVALLFGSFGTATSLAVLRQVNTAKIPQLLLIASTDRLTNPTEAPFTTILPPSAKVESGAFAKYVLSTLPKAKIAVIYQDDDFGKLYLANFKKGLGGKAADIVGEASTSVTDPTVESQIISLQATGADVLVHFTQRKATAQAISKVYDLKWNPVQLVTAPSSSIPTVMKVAGLEKSQNVISFTYFVDPGDPGIKKNPGFRKYLEFMAKWDQGADPEDTTNVTAYTAAEALVQILQRCGNDLSSANIMNNATNGEAYHLSLALPGIDYKPTADDHEGIRKLQPSRVTGDHYEPVGALIE
jgi:branched-chain amino acid transport system substrate-binding protein